MVLHSVGWNGRVIDDSLVLLANTNAFPELNVTFIGAIGGGSHYIVIKEAYQRASASMLAPFQYFQIIWATIYGLLVFDVAPDGWTWLGTAIIIASGLYVWSREQQLGKTRRSTSWRGAHEVKTVNIEQSIIPAMPKNKKDGSD